MKSITAYRIVRDKYASNPLDGQGAAMHAGRWNEVGHALVYLSDSPALAAWELFIHTDLAKYAQSIQDKYHLCRVEFDDVEIDSVEVESLPKKWSKSYKLTRKIGRDWWLAGKTPLLRVPSVVIPQSVNYLFNPAFKSLQPRCVLQPFVFDERLSDKIAAMMREP
jgi:RES domain-containing protein